ncbi:probable tubulin polyglutamylase TTLL2 [Hypanus sabinus]|uniref:probable tubulin polyglutamylase TTLL2 n=1 Tax=Hypanus sabinus TaxID=79690 RepID=UPI0028C3CABB|nr:probable tubulin polyglutamylase TTLL2 [Hypanus sabinus]
MANWSESEDLSKSLVFRLHEGTPEIIRDVLLERGWVEFDEKVQDKHDWNLYWRPGFSNAEYENIMPWQRLVHYPNSMGITRKDNLARNLKRMLGIYGPNIYNFSPVAFILPNNYTKFVAEYTKDKKANGGKPGYWICKPVDLSRGRGIFIFQDIKDLTYSGSVIVQKYITNPLLISGYKFDLRIYVCVTSFSPLTVYIYQEGLVRFGTEKYNLSSLDNIYAHLTNTSINRFGPSYTMDKERVGSGCKWTMSQFRAFLHSMNINEPLMWQRISNIVTMTLLTISPSIPSPPNCLELFGFDILIDDNIKPWLLEVNYSPALMIECNADVVVKKELLYDLIDLLNYKEIDTLRQKGYPRSWQYNTLSRSYPSFCIINSHRNLHSSTSKRRKGPLKETWSSSMHNHSLLLCRKSCSHSVVCNESSASEDPLVDSTKPEVENKSPQSSKLHLSTEGCIRKVHGSRGGGSAHCSETKESRKLTRQLPKKTLTSQLRESLNKRLNFPLSTRSTIDRSRLLEVHNALPDQNFRKVSLRLPTSTLKYDLPPFPQYSISDYDKKPITRIGDFILTFPFNEVTLKASQDPLNMRVIIQELQKLLKRQMFRETKNSKTKSEPHPGNFFNRREHFDPLLWGPRHPPLLSEYFSES